MSRIVAQSPVTYSSRTLNSRPRMRGLDTNYATSYGSSYKGTSSSDRYSSRHNDIGSGSRFRSSSTSRTGHSTYSPSSRAYGTSSHATSHRRLPHGPGPFDRNGHQISKQEALDNFRPKLSEFSRARTGQRTNADTDIQDGGNGEKLTETPVKPPSFNPTGEPDIQPRQTSSIENKARSIGSDGNSDDRTPDSSLSSEESMSGLRSQPQAARPLTGSDGATNPSNLVGDTLSLLAMEEPPICASQSTSWSHSTPAHETHGDLKLKMGNDEKEESGKQVQEAEGLSTEKKVELIQEKVECLQSDLQELLQVNTALLHISRKVVQGMVDLTCLLADLDQKD